jgi:hypothetical protein
MTSSNLYAEKIFANHPLAIWPLDDSADYISLITEAERDINTWTKTNATVITGSTPEITGIVQTEPFENSFRKVFRSTLPSGSNVTSYIKSPNLINFKELNSSLQTLSISTYYYTESSDIVSISVGAEYSSGSFTFKDFTNIELEQWIPISATFTYPDLDEEFKIVIKVISKPGGVTIDDYNIHFNGITCGQHSEEFNATSLGQTVLTFPIDINLSLDGVLPAYSYGLNANNGYYVVDNNSLVAKNFGVPLVYGSARAVEIIPSTEVVDRSWAEVAEESWGYWNNEESWNDVLSFTNEADIILNTKPSFIFPGYGFLNESGRNNDYTLEFWLQADVNTTEGKRILGPISSYDGLYVKDCFLILSIDGDFVSHFVGEWFRPMLIHVRVIKNQATLLVNGEVVGTLNINTQLMVLPSEFDNVEANKSNDWIGVYAYGENVDQIKIDCISIYPYSILTNLAKTNYILGQGVPKTSELIDNYYGGSSVEIDYPFANYSNNITYPTTRSWNLGEEDNLIPGALTLSTPQYSLPNFILAHSITEKTIIDLELDNALIQDEVYKFFTLKPSNNWANTSYVYFENLSFMKNGIDSILGVFKVIDDQDATLLLLRNGSNSFSIERKSISSVDYLTYIFTYNNVSTPIYSEVCPAGIFTAGIKISKLISENSIGGLSEFFANPASLKLYIGSNPNQNNMFTGNIYNVSINTPKETYAIDSFFEADGIIDSLANFVDYVGSYTLFSFEDFGKFFIDIAISGSWEDYIPLSSLAKDSFDENGQIVSDIDFIQFNIDYPAPPENKESGDTYWEDNNDLINTNGLNVRTFITFQNIVNGVTQIDSNYATNQPAIKRRILELDEVENWETKRFEIVDNYLIYPSKVIDFNDLAIVYLIKFKVFGILHNKIALRKLEFAAKTFDADRFNPITTRHAINLIPYNLIEESGDTELYDYKDKNPYLIDKESAPYLYLTRKSGIELKDGLVDLNRGLFIDINTNELEAVSISAIQMFIRSDLWAFPQSETLIFEIEDSLDTLQFYIKANSSNADRGTIIARTKSNNQIYTNINYYLDGLYVAEPTISIQRWSVLGISFPNNLNFNSFNGKINLKHLIMYNNISFYQGTRSQQEQRTIFRSWDEVNEESWGYWDNDDWDNVAIKRRDTRYVVNPESVYKNYTGTSRIVIDDNKGIYLETDSLTVFQDAIWQTQSLQ